MSEPSIAALSGDLRSLQAEVNLIQRERYAEAERMKQVDKTIDSFHDDFNDFRKEMRELSQNMQAMASSMRALEAFRADARKGFFWLVGIVLAVVLGRFAMWLISGQLVIV